MNFQLVGKVGDQELFLKVVHKLGRLFYAEDGKGNIVRVVYFSGAKALEYTGEIDQKFATRVKSEGHKVDVLEFDEDRGILKIVQS